MESELAGWLSIVFRFVHVLAAIMWIGNSLLFTWMELNLLPPKKNGDDPKENEELLGYLDMLHGGGVFHLQKMVLRPESIPVPLHWFMWQSYTTWISGVLLLISVYYTHGGSALLDASKSTLTGSSAIALSVGGLIFGWLIYDLIWRSKLKEQRAIAIPLSLVLIVTAAWSYNQCFNGRAVFLQIGAMMATLMTANVFIHIIQNQKKFMVALKAGLPHDLKYGKQAKLRSMHNHYMTFPVLFLMLSGHFPQLTSAAHSVPILAVLIVSLMAIKYWMNSRYQFKHWLKALFATFIAAVGLIALLLNLPGQSAPGLSSAAAEGSKLFLNQGCAACHQTGSTLLAPQLAGIFDSLQMLADGSQVKADEAYLRESISLSQAKIVKGYPAAMAAYTHLSEEQLDQLIAYLKTL
jgi:uncharacterized membrane protein